MRRKGEQIRVKICGITNLTDAKAALAAGADLLGFILYAKSARHVEKTAVTRIVDALQRDGLIHSGVRLVGVFVNEPLTTVHGVLAETGLDYAQLHGDEQPEIVRALDGHAYKALRPASEQQATAEAAVYAALGPASGPRWLIDAYDPTAYGGTGHRADWPTAARLAEQYPGLLLAGGLTPTNVAAAVTAVQPWGVDVASGVERSPGHKNHEAVRAFIQAAKTAKSVW
jgi:phosphoribosylanthranilate isomerase